ncbi:hypothetical protein [Nonomuraea jabiensis]|uniref:hypothetical protein n=1 Tax=Nonomuraea jabiensis TaxID=882448 RepID=UPI003D736105
MDLAKKNGKLKGKQPKLPAPARRSTRRRYAEGEVSLADLATEYSVGRSGESSRRPSAAIPLP